ncbi:MAG: NUDIX hydrolase [Bacteroidetes bacterium]|nr:MAG: NUDIX hydrolase [Bacteroidota bacterium]
MKNKRVAIAYIENDKGELLFGRRKDSNLYTTPGGSVEEKELPIVGLVREVKEETGIEVESAELIDVSYNADKNIFIYLYKVTSPTTIFASPTDPIKEKKDFKDPDKEVSEWMFLNPYEIRYELHVPLEENVVMKYWASH